MLLEPLIINDDCLDMLIKTNSLDGITRLILLQRMKCDIEGVVNGEIVPATGNKNLLSYPD